MKRIMKVAVSAAVAAVFLVTGTCFAAVQGMHTPYRYTVNDKMLERVADYFNQDETKLTKDSNGNLQDGFWRSKCAVASGDSAAKNTFDITCTDGEVTDADGNTTYDNYSGTAGDKYLKFVPKGSDQINLYNNQLNIGIRDGNFAGGAVSNHYKFSMSFKVDTEKTTAGDAYFSIETGANFRIDVVTNNSDGTGKPGEDDMISVVYKPHGGAVKANVNPYKTMPVSEAYPDGKLQAGSGAVPNASSFASKECWQPMGQWIDVEVDIDFSTRKMTFTSAPKGTELGHERWQQFTWPLLDDYTSFNPSKNYFDLQTNKAGAFCVDNIQFEHEQFVIGEKSISVDNGNIIATAKIANDLTATTYQSESNGFGTPATVIENKTTPAVIVAVYDSNNQLLAVKPATAELDFKTNATPTYTEVKATVAKPAGAAKAKMFIWKTLDGDITPFAEFKELAIN